MNSSTITRNIKELWFIHIPKCGGTSIKKAIGVNTGHQTLSSMKKSMADKHYNNSFKFSFVRNPYSRLQSLYMFNKKHKIKGLQENIPFNDWITATLLRHEKPYYYDASHFAPAIDWITVDDQIGVDFVGTVESIYHDFDKLCYMLGIEARLPHLNESTQPIPTYCKTNRELIKQVYYRDLKKWYPWCLYN